MADLNRAYRVLSDPTTRFEYDRQLRNVTTEAHRAPEPPTPPAEPRVPPRPFSDAAGQVLSPPGPARFPWRTVVVASIVGAVGVIALSASRGPARTPAPDGVLTPGFSCVAVEPNTDVREVACVEGVNLVVEAIVDFGAACPVGLEAHRDRQGSGVACVAERVLGR